MKTLIKHTSAGFLAMLTVFFILLFALAAKGQSPLVVQGGILSPEGIISYEKLELVLPDGTVQAVPLKAGKRFKISLPGDGMHYLCVHKPGCRTKVVAIDTRNFQLRHEAIVVRFDVELEPTEMEVEPGSDVHLAGRIAFHRSNGRLLHERLPYFPADMEGLLAAEQR